MGQVPVLEYNDHVVSESIVCDDFLEEMYPQIPLYPKAPYLRARHKTIMVQFEKLAEAFTQLKSTNSEIKQNAQESYVNRIGIFENMLTDTYFAGSSPGMVDFHIWPWYERIPALEKFIGMNLLPEEQYPKLNAWMKTMLQLPAVKEIWIPDDQYIQFFVSLSTCTPNYDAALETNL